jgi:glycosyltransferase involved in cell wall biosynthesis
MENKEFEKLPVSVVMVIHNEEAVIERALRSCADIADEIIVIHDGKCSDKSLEIARRYTDNILEAERIGQAEKHRVKTYEMARNDWILQLDADEYLSSSLKSELKNLLAGDVDIYEVSWSTFHNQKHYFWHYKRALFRKSKVYFIGISHESVKLIDARVSIKRIPQPLLHEPLYNNVSLAAFHSKWKNWARIQARQLTEDFSAIPKWNCPLTDWERHRRVRIQHPILLGMIATTAYHACHSAKNLLKYRNSYFLKLGIFASLYHIHLYYYLNKYRRNEKK